MSELRMMRYVVWVLSGALACAAQAAEAPLPSGYWKAPQARTILDRTATVRLAPSLDPLSAAEREAVEHLLAAGVIVQRVYERSLHAQALTAQAQLEQLDAARAHSDPTRDLLDLYRLFQGPIAITLDNQRVPFLPVAVESPGRNVYPDGITRDVTDKATWKLDRDDHVTRNANRFTPKADGDAKLTVGFESHHVDVPIGVKQAAVDPPISFKLDVMPVFMRAGCNVGSCHGSARGKDGFRLSLFGFDPDGDYYRLTHEQPKRRLDLSIPAECLFIEKAAGQVPHSGGSPTKKGDPLYNTLVRWLEAEVYPVAPCARPGPL